MRIGPSVVTFLFMIGFVSSQRILFESGPGRGKEFEVIIPLIGEETSKNDWTHSKNDEELVQSCDGMRLPKVWRTGESAESYDYITAGRILSPPIELSASRCSTFTLEICHFYETMKNVEGGNVVIQRTGDEPNGPLTVLYPSAGKPYGGLIGGSPQSSVPNLIRSERGFTGSSDGWVKSYFDISSYRGKTIRFGFDFAAPDSRTSKGWLIGSARILCDSVVHVKDVKKAHEMSLDEAVKIFQLQRPEPEPFGSSTIVSFVLPIGTHVRLDVLDPSGNRVRTLVDSTMQAGFHKAYWDARNDRDREVPEGVYYFHFGVEGFEAIQRSTYLKREPNPEVPQKSPPR